MRFLPIFTIVIALAIPLNCFSQEATREVPDAIRQGTMTNEKLRKDALTGVVSVLASRGCENFSQFTPYVTKLPSGTPGSRIWQEVWVAVCSNGKFPIRVDFSEDGKNAANWTIR